ncbi:MAG: hypothetical protein ACJ731_06975 [Vicinamibacterales bacterium]
MLSAIHPHSAINHPHFQSDVLRHWAIPVLTFGAITAAWLFPVLANLSTVIPGSGAGDNVTFVWDVWWMRYVLHHPGQTFFFTPFLFHPIGIDLTLHTHTALPALIGAAASSPIAGQNGVIVLHIFLNFLCTYALSHRLTAQIGSSVAAAMIFGTSVFVSAHLNGHFNLIAAWTLPLVCLLTLNALNGARWQRGALVGLALAATAYIDYYLFVYAVIIVLLFWASWTITVTLDSAPYSPFRRRVLLALLWLVVTDALVIGGILLLPGDRLDLGSIHISLRSVRNPITFAWILLLAAALIVASARVRIEMDRRLLWHNRNAAIAAITTTLVLLLPLLTHAAAVWRTGSYVSQVYFWRSGPAGIDAATLLLGSPFHAVWGNSVRALYDRFHIDVIESSGWIPVSAMALAIAGLTSRARSRAMGPAPWALTGTVFTIWAIGPWVNVIGRQTPLIMPAVFLRFIPIVANARVPGRAMVVVYLSIAMLAAIGFRRLIAGGRASRIIAACLFVTLIIECVPARPPLYLPHVASQYFALHEAAPAAAVCELPLGLRDGFGETGSLDEAVLLHQTIHEHPIVGGFVARLPPAIARTYDTMPVIRSLLRLSSGGSASDDDARLSRAQAAAKLASAGIAYVVLDLRRATPELVRYVQSRIELHSIGEEDGRLFYEVVHLAEGER